MFSEFDRLAMTRALALAERGLETAHPNPRVGCVITKGDRIIGEGWHERAGEAHAEVAALHSAKEPVAGATAYVTLEPCSHHGRTPPCVNALIEARIARVVFAVQDPNPRVSGQGADALLRAGITVEAGLMEAEARELNIGFMKRMKDGLPWVRVKLAMSLDGRTALASGASQWITGEPARNDVQRWRARCSAVMTGIGTVIADDPLLNVRVAGFKGRQPLRVVLDSRLQCPPAAKMLVGLSGAAPGGAASSAGAPGGSGGAAGVRGAGGGAVGGAAGVRGAGGSAVGAAAGAEGRASAGVAAGSSGAAGAVAGASGASGAVGAPGAVLIFTAIGGGSPAANVARPAASTTPETLSDDLAALVSAFEASPTSVSARSADVAGPASVRTDAPSAAHGASGAVSDDATWAGAALSGAKAVPAAPKSASGSAEGTGASAAAAAAAAPAAGSAAGAASAVAVPAKGGAASDAAGAAAPAPGGAPGGAPSGAPGSAITAGIARASAIPSLGAAPSASSSPPASASAPALAPTSSPASAAASPATSSAPLAGLPTGTLSAAAGPPPATTVPTSAAPPTVTPRTVAPPTAAPSTVAPPAGSAPAGTAPTSAKPIPQPDSPAAFQARRAALLARGARVEEVPADEGFLDLFAVLQKLAELEVNEVLVEAGPTLAGQLLTTFFADELLLYIAPKLLGPQGRPLVNLPELQSLQDAWGFSLFDAKRFGDDLRLRLRPK